MCMDSSNKKIDTCMVNLIRIMNENGIKTKACCCGHSIYPMTIVIDFEGMDYEIVSNIYLKRKKRFYIKDKGGFYYIPETLGIQNRSNMPDKHKTFINKQTQ